MSSELETLKIKYAEAIGMGAEEHVKRTELEEKLAAAEFKVKEFRQSMSANGQRNKERIDQLENELFNAESENKRLREALEQTVGVKFDEKRFYELMQAYRAAVMSSTEKETGVATAYGAVRDYVASLSPPQAPCATAHEATAGTGDQNDMNSK